MAIYMTVEARDSEAGLHRLTVVRGVEFLLRKRRHQQTQTVELNGRQEIFEQSVKVIEGDACAPRYITKLGPVLQKNGRRKLRQKRVGDIELNVKTFQTGKHIDL